MSARNSFLSDTWGPLTSGLSRREKGKFASLSGKGPG